MTSDSSAPRPEDSMASIDAVDGAMVARSPPNSVRQVVAILGLPFDALTMTEAVAYVQDAVRARRRLFISTPNLNFVISARRDPSFRRSVLCSELSLADGMPIVWISRLLGLSVRERVSGADLFESLCQAETTPPIKVYIFGGPDGAAQEACERLNDRHCGLVCVGSTSPGFGTLDELSSDRFISAINDANADFVVVSLGAAKGQAWICRNKDKLLAPIISHLGAVVNFTAGHVKRAPRWMQRVGMEWLWRTLQEPGLWRRYGSDAASLASVIVTEVLPLWARGLRPSRADHEPMDLTVVRDTPVFTVRLAGGINAGVGVALARAVGNRVSGVGSLVCADVHAVTHIDAYGVAHLMQWNGHLKQRHGQFVLERVPDELRRQLARYGAEFLMDAPDVRVDEARHRP